MFREILKRPGSGKEKLKMLLIYLSRKRGAKKAWDARHGIVFDHHPEFNSELDKGLRSAHREVWEPFNRSFNDATLKICRSTSGSVKPNPLIIPEEIFQTDIEPSLNRHPEAHYLAHKSFYNRLYEKGVFPDDLLHVVNGELLDDRYKTIDIGQAEALVENFSYPLVVKPNIDTWGGSEIQFVKGAKTLKKVIRSKQNIVVQKKILQHTELAKYHEKSLNTVRVYLYKSVSDNSVHIVNTVFRMGNGMPIDNVASGGLVSLVKDDGFMHGYALDRYGKKYTEHPLSGLPFTGEIPEFGELQNLATEIARKLFLLRVVGLDLCYDESGRWRAIEINTKGHSIRFAQYAGVPFFGNFTPEVISYCKKNHWAIT